MFFVRLFVCLFFFFLFLTYYEDCFIRQKTFRVLFTVREYDTLCFRILVHQRSTMFRFETLFISGHLLID